MTPSGHASRFTKILSRVGIGLLILTVPFSFLPGEGLTLQLFVEQDFPVLAFVALVLLAMAVRPDALLRARLWRAPRHSAALLITAVLVVAAAGTWLVMGDYAVTRDEILADFDAAHLRAGWLIAPVPVEWRPFADAMMPQFMLPVAEDAGWTSTYLPGNAALRAVVDLAVGKAWTNPLLAAVSAFALFRIARRLWPQTPATALVPLLLLVASPQFLAMAMTPYAMTAHLAFNLLWLWCFLRNDRCGDAGAMLAGFVATGLHQIVFHPIFVLPFIVELLLARRWLRAVLYVLVYAAIGLFWVSYWKLILLATGLSAASGDPASEGLSQLVQHVVALVSAFDFSNPLLMLLNLFRFAAWQHLLLLPLFLLGLQAIRRAEGIARPLAAGIVLMLATTLIVMPWQGFGWGYRYLHGFLGSFCLLAGYGWAKAVEPPDRTRRVGALALTTAITLFTVLPFLLFSAHRMIAPYREAQDRIGRIRADVVLVDGSELMSLVRNKPDGSNRPVVMDLFKLDASKLRILCNRYTVAVFAGRDAVQAGFRARDAGKPPPSKRC